jgi:hypothetical protein
MEEQGISEAESRPHPWPLSLLERGREMAKCELDRAEKGVAYYMLWFWGRPTTMGRFVPSKIVFTAGGSHPIAEEAGMDEAS